MELAGLLRFKTKRDMQKIIPIQHKYGDCLPQILPQKMSGKLSHKIVIKKDYTRPDGTNAIYLQLIQGRKIKRIPLEISVPAKAFDSALQRVRGHYRYSAEYNLLIGKILADLNSIMVNYKLTGTNPKLELVVQDLVQPSLRANFNEFAQHQLHQQRELKIIESTFLQQKGALKKIARFRDPILFSDIDDKLIDQLRYWCANTLNNKPATVESTIKTFKKYVHLANKQGIATPINYEDISVKRMIGDRTFLSPKELKRLYEYYQSHFVSPTHKAILQRYLFSCFTGIRISDIEQLGPENLFGDHLGFTMHKTKKFIRIKLNKSALSLIGNEQFFGGSFSRKTINEELKHIAKTLGITKRLYFHSSRHTFATNFLISGGDVINLQRLLGHQDIKQTMVYVHIVQDITDKQVDLLDEIIK